MKILYCYNRFWSADIFKYLSKKFEGKINFVLVTNKEEFKLIDFRDYELLLFIGWSYMVPDEIVNSKLCVCLHPSPLPKYRGGSPIQNQIMNGETSGAVSLFLMGSGVDTGPIISQIPMSLKGDLHEIIDRMVDIGKSSIETVILEYLETKKIKSYPQNNNIATTFKRLTKEESEITIDEINNSDPIRLYNKIRSLQDPYPNAFIRCKNGKKLYITHCKPE